MGNDIMNSSVYLKKLGKIQYSEIQCPSCGSTVMSTSPAGSFCHFCEMFASEEDVHKVDSATRKVLKLATAARSNGDWASSMAALAALEDSEDPLILYGIGRAYGAFSDYTYYSVNYSLGGFMNPNADKRNDEFNRNPNNSMRLLSKAKEHMFSAIYIIKNEMDSRDWLYMYTQFMAELKMKKIAQAAISLSNLEKNGITPVNAYAEMAYSVEMHSKDAERFLKPMLERGELNAFYYLARHLAWSGRLDESRQILIALCAKVYMPMGMQLLNKANETIEATSL